MTYLVTRSSKYPPGSLGHADHLKRVAFPVEAGSPNEAAARFALDANAYKEPLAVEIPNSDNPPGQRFPCAVFILTARRSDMP